MIKINLHKYKSVIFDFDGVITDSNNVKKNAIEESVRGVLPEDRALEFVNYFVGNNGIPREEKIEKYVPKTDYNKVLDKYESILNNKLKDAPLMPGVQDFIIKIKDHLKHIIVLSGGTETEVKELLIQHNLMQYFDGVYGGPLNKEQHLLRLSLDNPSLYFGDSKVDYEMSIKFDFDFVFVYGATSIINWELDTSGWKMVSVIRDFNNIGIK